MVRQVDENGRQLIGKERKWPPLKKRTREHPSKNWQQVVIGVMHPGGRRGKLKREAKDETVTKSPKKKKEIECHTFL